MNAKIYSNTLKSNMKKIYVSMIIFGALILGIIGYVAFDYITYSVNAPEIDSSSQLRLFEEDTIVKITTSKFFYTGFYDEVDGKIKGYYYFIDIDGRYVTVRSKKDYTEEYPTQVHTFKGVIHKDPYFDENLETFAYMAEISEADAKYLLLSYEISDDYENDNLKMLFICIPFSIFFFIYIAGLKKNRKNREALIAYTDIENAESSFDQEFNSENKVKSGALTITPSWIFSKQIANTYLLPTNEIVWAYKIITRHSTYGIPTGKTYSINFCFSNGTEQSFGSSQKYVDYIISFTEQNCPRTYFGFSDELKQQWCKNRQSFIDDWKNQGHEDIPFNYE